MRIKLLLDEIEHRGKVIDNLKNDKTDIEIVN